MHRGALVCALGACLAVSAIGAGADDPGAIIHDHSTRDAWGASWRIASEDWDAIGADFRYRRENGDCPPRPQYEPHSVYICSGNPNSAATTVLLERHTFEIKVNDRFARRDPEQVQNTACHEMGHAAGVGQHYTPPAESCRLTFVPIDGTPYLSHPGAWDARDLAAELSGAQAPAKKHTRKHGGRS